MEWLIKLNVPIRAVSQSQLVTSVQWTLIQQALDWNNSYRQQEEFGFYATDWILWDTTLFFFPGTCEIDFNFGKLYVGQIPRIFRLYDAQKWNIESNVKSKT